MSLSIRRRLMRCWRKGWLPKKRRLAVLGREHRRAEALRKKLIRGWTQWVGRSMRLRLPWRPAIEEERAAEAAAAAQAGAPAASDVGGAAPVQASPPPRPGPPPKPMDLPSFEGLSISPEDAAKFSMLNDVQLRVKVELGRTRMLVEDVLKLDSGSVVELNKLAGDPVDVYVNERLIARGEVLVLNDSFCVRVSEIVSDDPHRVAL
jgi:flagellar motor switch protein FliN